MLVWGQPRDVRTASNEVADRAREALQGVPSETRKALKDGTTLFERILPGPNRMYPDTDLPPIALTPERVARIRSQLPMPPWELEEQYKACNVPPSLAHSMVLDPRRKVFEQALQIADLDGCAVARIMGQTMRHLRRKRVPVEAIPDATLLRLFQLMAKARITASAFPKLLSVLARAPQRQADEVADEFFPILPPEPTLEEKVLAVLRDIPPAEWKRNDPEKEYHILMGRVFAPYRGRVRGVVVGNLVRTFVEKGGVQ